jgi:prepilin peptidase CpaA
MSPEIVKTVVLCTFAGLVIGAAVKDISTFTIPNWISIALTVAFVPAALAVGVSFPTIGISFAIGLAALVLAIGMFALGWIGGGDAKLMAAAAVWVGLRGIGPYAIYTGLAGGALALALVALRSAWLRPFAEAGPGWARRLATPGESAPYGVAIAVGALAAFALHPLA